MGEFLRENASAVFTILAVLISGIFAFITMWFRSRREVQYRLAEKLMERRLAAHEAVLRLSGTMREMAGTEMVDAQGEIVRFPRVFMSRDSFYQWYDSYHQLKMDWETWFSTEVNREMYLLQDYLYHLHLDITKAGPEVFPAIGVIVRQDFIDFSANLERLARQYLSNDLLRLRLVNPDAHHKYQRSETYRRLNQTAYMLNRETIQQAANQKKPGAS